MAKGSKFFSGRGATSPGQKAEVVSVQVGKRHPYLVPPPEGGQALSLATGFPTFQMFLTPPLDGEISSLSGTLAGCGLFADRSLNAVIPVFVFSGSGAGEWAIHAPVDDSPELVSSWIGSDTNIVNFVLMDRSGTVQVLPTSACPMSS